MVELEKRITALERQLTAACAELKQQSRSARVTRWLLAAAGLFFGLNLSLPITASTQAVPPATPKAVTKIDVPVVFMDGGRTVAEMRRGGLVLYGLSADARWDIGVTSTNNLFFQGTEGGVAAVKLERRGLSVFNDKGVPVASFGSTQSGSGEMLLGNSTSGNSIVEAGMMPDGRGVVRVYPQGGPPPTVIPKTLMGGSPK